MTNLEREYFNTFTLERLKSFRKAVSKEQKGGFWRGQGHVTKVWMRPGGKQIIIRINRRKIDAAIKEREGCLNQT